jgi:dual specificity protein phosphatase-like protein
MERVLDRLWIGSSEDFRAPLGVLGFSAVVDLRDGEVSAVPGVEIHRVNQRDGDPWSPDQVHRTLAFIAERVRTGKVLVACAAGMSRSASMAIGYLVYTGWSPAEAHERVRAARPRIQPVPKMLISVLGAVLA